MRIARYIVAGGMSSRMGRDKAMIALGGRTMLARVVDTFRALHPSESVEMHPQVTVLGERTLLEGGDRAICDSYPGCGPLGGIEAALDDLAKTGAAEWALFLPVDMPFLPPGLVSALLKEWAGAAADGYLACVVAVDGRPQPLISLIHRELRPLLAQALRAGEFRVTPVLNSVCNALASDRPKALGSSHSVLWQTRLTGDEVSPINRVWLPSAAQRRSSHLWFTNLNTEHDLEEAETFLRQQGSINGREKFPIRPQQESHGLVTEP